MLIVDMFWQEVTHKCLIFLFESTHSVQLFSLHHFVSLFLPSSSVFSFVSLPVPSTRYVPEDTRSNKSEPFFPSRWDVNSVIFFGTRYFIRFGTSPLEKGSLMESHPTSFSVAAFAVASHAVQPHIVHKSSETRLVNTYNFHSKFSSAGSDIR